MGTAPEHFAAEDRAADRLIDAAHLLHTLGGQADLVARTGIVADGGRHVRILHAVSVRQTADRVELVEFHSIAVFGNKLFCDRAQCFAQVLILLVGAVADDQGPAARSVYIAPGRSWKRLR